MPGPAKQLTTRQMKFAQLTSPQARPRQEPGHKLRVQASGVQSLQARGPGTQSTSVQAGPGHKLPGHMYSFYA